MPRKQHTEPFSKPGDMLGAAPFLMLVFLPIAAALKYVAHSEPIWIFVTGALAVAALADWIRRATEHVASHAGPAIGGLLSVSFGSIAELLLAFFVLSSNGAAIVRAQIIGSIIGTSLLGLGLAILAGGIRFKSQKFDRESAGRRSSMLVLIVVALLLPAIFNLAANSRNSHQHGAPVSNEGLSLAISVVLLALYACGLIYTLITRENAFSSEKEGVKNGPVWTLRGALMTLAGATAAIAFGADMIAEAMQQTAQSLGLPLLFLAVVPVALMGTSSDLVAAVSFARQDRMNLVMSICIGSAIQVALVVAPLLVIASWVIGRPMTLVFPNALDLFAVASTAFIVNAISSDGQTTWFEGVLLIGVYTIIAAAFFFMG
jgi:Ca2+:H+ antiporter